MAKKDVEEGKVCAALAYLFPIGLVWYLLDDAQKKNKFVQFHISQSLVALIFVVAGAIAASVLTLLSFGLLSFVVLIVWIAALVWFIQGLVYSLQGKEEELFLIGRFGNKIKI